LNLIVVFRIKTYEDFDTNVPLMGMSIDVFHFMGKNKSGGNMDADFPQTRFCFCHVYLYLRRGGNSFLMLKNVSAAYAKGV
jgi:hypothetical protein